MTVKISELAIAQFKRNIRIGLPYQPRGIRTLVWSRDDRNPDMKTKRKGLFVVPSCVNAAIADFVYSTDTLR